MRGSEESKNARKRLGRIERAISTLCFFLPKASTITSPVGGNEGGAGREDEEGAGEEGTGEDGWDGGGAGHGDGETRGGESGDVIMVRWGWRRAVVIVRTKPEGRRSHFKNVSKYDPKPYCLLSPPNIPNIAI